MRPDSPLLALYVLDYNRAASVAASLASLFSSSRRDDTYAHVVITDPDVAEWAETVLYGAARATGSPCESRVSIYQWRDCIPIAAENRWYSAAALGRLQLEEYLPANVSKVLYLDTDTVIQSDLATLWSMDLEGAVLGAVVDPWAPRRRIQWTGHGVLRIDEGWDEPGYFNSGVMLIDVDVWREREMSERCVALYNDHWPQLRSLDQDVLNCLLDGHWSRLAAHWNVLAFCQGESLPGDSRDPSVFASAGVLHYSGPSKPWDGSIGHQYLDSRYLEAEHASAKVLNEVGVKIT